MGHRPKLKRLLAAFATLILGTVTGAVTGLADAWKDVGYTDLQPVGKTARKQCVQNLPCYEMLMVELASKAGTSIQNAFSKLPLALTQEIVRSCKGAETQFKGIECWDNSIYGVMQEIGRVYSAAASNKDPGTIKIAFLQELATRKCGTYAGEAKLNCLSNGFGSLYSYFEQVHTPINNAAAYLGSVATISGACVAETKNEKGCEPESVKRAFNSGVLSGMGSKTSLDSIWGTSTVATKETYCKTDPKIDFTAPACPKDLSRCEPINEASTLYACKPDPDQGTDGSSGGSASSTGTGSGTQGSGGGAAFSGPNVPGAQKGSGTYWGCDSPTTALKSVGKTLSDLKLGGIPLPVANLIGKGIELQADVMAPVASRVLCHASYTPEDNIKHSCLEMRDLYSELGGLSDDEVVKRIKDTPSYAKACKERIRADTIDALAPPAPPPPDESRCPPSIRQAGCGAESGSAPGNVAGQYAQEASTLGEGVEDSVYPLAENLLRTRVLDKLAFILGNRYVASRVDLGGVTPSKAQSELKAELGNLAQSCPALKGGLGELGGSLGDISDADLDAGRIAKRKRMALAARCMASLGKVQADLRYRLGYDIPEVEAILPQEKIDDYFRQARLQARRNYGHTSAMSYAKRYQSHVYEAFANMVTDLPGISASKKAALNARLTAKTERECGGVKQLKDSSGGQCRSYHEEFAAITGRMTELAAEFPELASQIAGGTRVYDEFAQLAGYDDSDIVRSCKPLREGHDVPEESLTAIDMAVKRRNTEAVEQTFIARLRDLCNPKYQKGIVAWALGTPGVADEIFACEPARGPKLSAQECKELQDLKWAACRSYRESLDDASMVEAGMTFAEVLGDALTIYGFGAGLGKAVAVKGTQMLVGGFAGLGMHGLFSSEHEIEALEVAFCQSGYSSGIEDCEKKIANYATAMSEDKQFADKFTAFVEGAVGSMLTPEEVVQAIKKPGKLMQIYKKYIARKKNTPTPQQIEADEYLRLAFQELALKVDPELSPATVRAMDTDELVNLLSRPEYQKKIDGLEATAAKADDKVDDASDIGSPPTTPPEPARTTRVPDDEDPRPVIALVPLIDVPATPTPTRPYQPTIAKPMVAPTTPVKIKKLLLMKDRFQEAAWMAREEGLLNQRDKIEKYIGIVLRDSPVVETKPLTNGRGTELVLQDGVRAVFVPETPGKPSVQHELAFGALDRVLGLNVAPVAVERNIGGVKGTLQLLMEDAPTATELRDGGYRVDPPDQRIGLLDYLTNNSSRSGDTYRILREQNGRQVASGEGAAFGTELTEQMMADARRYATQWVADASIEIRLRGLKKDTLKKMLGRHVTDEEIAAVLKRRDYLLEQLKKNRSSPEFVAPKVKASTVPKHRDYKEPPPTMASADPDPFEGPKLPKTDYTTVTQVRPKKTATAARKATAKLPTPLAENIEKFAGNLRFALTQSISTQELLSDDQLKAAATTFSAEELKIYQRAYRLLNDPEHLTDFMETVMKEAAQFMMLSGNPEVALLAKEGKITRGAMQNMLVERARELGWDRWVRLKSSCCSPQQFKDDVLAHQALFYDTPLKNNTHGMDVHIYQILSIGPDLDREFGAGTTKRLIDRIGKDASNDPWDTLFDTNDSSLSCPEFMSSVIASVGLPVNDTRVSKGVKPIYK